jgi:hypothetical protein
MICDSDRYVPLVLNTDVTELSKTDKSMRSNRPNLTPLMHMQSPCPVLERMTRLMKGDQGGP